MANLLGKGVTKDKPYATFEGEGYFGTTTAHLLKVYQESEEERINSLARWFVAMKTDQTFGSFDIGDSYLSEVVHGLHLTYASDAFLGQYLGAIEE
jgi:hypothetical protein